MQKTTRARTAANAKRKANDQTDAKSKGELQGNKLKRQAKLNETLQKRPERLVDNYLNF